MKIDSMADAAQYYLGIDGGGTRSRAVLLSIDSRQPRLIADFDGGPTNPTKVGWTLATTHLHKTVRGVLEKAGMSTRDVTFCCFALAGAGAKERADRIRDSIVNELGIDAHRFRLTHDADPLLYAGSDDGVGIALISGTGSLAWGRGGDGTTARSGGKGALSGDEGSGTWIARLALQAIEQLNPDSVDTAEFCNALRACVSAESNEQARQVLVPSEEVNAALPRLPPVVFEWARAGNPTALQMIERAADSLAALVLDVQQRIPEFADFFPLTVAGSLLVKDDLLLKMCLQELRNHGVEPSPLQIVQDPATAAAKLAQRWHA